MNSNQRHANDIGWRICPKAKYFACLPREKYNRESGENREIVNRHHM
jgi:hypothetical protein